MGNDVINDLMFREYDVRGRVSETELNERTVELIARGFATLLNSTNINEVVVGYDSRKCSEKFRDALIKGLLSSGCNVVDIGMALSPILYFAQHHLKMRGGVMITGSHNPPDWSGFKMSTDFSSTLQSEDIQRLLKIIKSGNFISGKGELRLNPIKNAYYNDLLSRVRLKRPLKIVVDAGNGTAGIFAPDILRSMGCEVIEIFCDLDTSFPNHFPNPSDLSGFKWLIDKVTETSADIGLAFDGDGDRLGVVDEQGKIIYADRIMLLLARQVLKDKPGGKIVFDVKCSQSLMDDIVSHGGVPVMWKTGHSHIKAKMKKEKAILAGERSGHIFFPPDWQSSKPLRDQKDFYYGFDDAVFSSLRLLAYLSNETRTVHELLEEADPYITSPEIHIDYPDDKKYELVDRLTEEFKQEYEDVISINGARVRFPAGWGLVRASSNLPELVLVFEATDLESLQEIKDIFKDKLIKHGCTAIWKGDV